jgi:type VI secretion system secreted protein Hcp
LAYSFGVSSASLASGNGGAASNVSFSDLRIIKVLDKSSPILFQDTASAKLINNGTLELVRPDGQVFMDYKLSNVLVTSVQDLGSGKDGTTDEQVSLRFSKIEWDYTPYDATGHAGSTVTGSWDRLTNQPSLPGSTSAPVSPGNGGAVSSSPGSSPTPVTAGNVGTVSDSPGSSPAPVTAGNVGTVSDSPGSSHSLVSASKGRTVSKKHRHGPLSTGLAIGRVKSAPHAKSHPARLRRHERP